MPLEKLLAIYGGGMHNAPGSSGEVPKDTGEGECSLGSSSDGSAISSSEEEILESQDLTLDKEEIARDLLSPKPRRHDDHHHHHNVDHLMPSSSSSTARLLRCECSLCGLFLACSMLTKKFLSSSTTAQTNMLTIV